MASLDPTKAKGNQAKIKSKKQLDRLGAKVAELELSEHESIIAAEVIAPEDIQVRFEGLSSHT